jgi:threonine synthase
MSGSAFTLACSGCGAAPQPDDPYPFRCPNAARGDDIDHVVARILDPAVVRFPSGEERDPFVRYRQLFHSYHLAADGGMPDQEYVALIGRLEERVAAVDGRGFAATRFGRSGSLSEALGFGPNGGVWVKDETGNVSGSHKARHLMGLLIHLEVAEHLGLTNDGVRPDLAIASCGNAALAAAVVAAAGERALRVFVPTWADPVVVARLEALGAAITVCPRDPGVPGDPTYHRLQEAVGEGALPFTCQGNENGLAIEGGETIGYELATDLLTEGIRLDRLFVQVGGGALASAVIQAMAEAHQLGAMAAMPRVHAVQTVGGHPLNRAYDLLAGRVLGRMHRDGATGPAIPDDEGGIADLMASPPGTAAAREELRYAATHRSEFMWPWEDEPKSIAHGILDDETYDWLAIVDGMRTTAGFPVLADEETLAEANDLAAARTSIPVDHTGSAGLAGLLELQHRGLVGPQERVAVLFTGVRR